MASASKLGRRLAGIALGLALLALLALPLGAAATPRAHLQGSRAVAPKVVEKMIRAGNRIRHKKYFYCARFGLYRLVA